MSDALNIVRRLSDLSADHGPDDWPAVQMRDITALCGEVARLRALSAQPAAVPGWQWVPVEPTPEMCKAAVIFANGNAVYKNVAAEALRIEEAIYGEAYAAMLAAAPQAPQQGEAGHNVGIEPPYSVGSNDGVGPL